MKHLAIIFLISIFSFSFAPTHSIPTKGEVKVSWYGPGFQGRLTANGERFDMNKITAAHKSLKFGTKVKITNEKSGKSVVVRINDRGPYIRGREFDLSKAAFQKISSINNGVIRVKYEILK